MPKTREFHKLPRKSQVWLVYTALNMAMSEPADMRKEWRTDVYGVAMQYRPQLRREDFDLIKGMTLEEIMKILLEEETKE
jgi:hypothetical protein